MDEVHKRGIGDRSDLIGHETQSEGPFKDFHEQGAVECDRVGDYMLEDNENHDLQNYHAREREEAVHDTADIVAQ